MTASRLAFVAPILAGSWAAFNGWLYAADAGRRYRAESAWFVFAFVMIVVAILAIVRGTPSRSDAPAAKPRILDISLIGFLLGSALLYYQMLSIGLLSDDFPLLARSQAGTLVDPAWEFLRPLPRLIWRLVSGIRLFDAATALHALNVGLHGLNAWLASLLAARFGLPPRLALLAGVLFLVCPASVEAVVWAAGVFDVLLTSLVLTACIVLTAATSSLAATIAVALLTAAALMTKETAVVMPAMLIVTAVCASHTTLRQSTGPIAASVGLIALYFPIRIALGFAGAPPSGDLSGYALKEMLSRPFGTLGLPFHVDFMRSQSWVTFAFALLWPTLFAWSATTWAQRRDDATRAVACTAWILASVLPLATMLFIADDLQGARYVYLGSAAFSILIAVLVQSIKPSVRWIVIVPVIAIFILATRAHQSPWSDAARERDRVLAAYRDSGLNCSPHGARGLPDHIRGAYVFRNGFVEAVGAITPPAAWDASCVLVWDGIRFTPN